MTIAEQVVIDDGLIWLLAAVALVLLIVYLIRRL